MHIENKLASLKIWAERNKLLLIEGECQLHRSPVVDIPNSENNTLETFQEIIMKLDSKVIIYDYTYFDAEYFEYCESILQEIDDEDLKQKFELFRKFEDKYLGFNLLIFKEGVTFRYGEYISEISDYLEIQKAVKYHERENTSSKTIPQDKITTLAKQLAESDNYSKLKNRSQRESLAKEMLSSQINELGANALTALSSIITHAEIYYQNTIKPEKENELKLKVTELKDKGWTKVKIAATLGVSKDTVSKYL